MVMRRDNQFITGNLDPPTRNDQLDKSCALGSSERNEFREVHTQVLRFQPQTHTVSDIDLIPKHFVACGCLADGVIFCGFGVFVAQTRTCHC